MFRIAKPRFASIAVPAVLGLVLAGGLALGASGIASAQGTTPNVMVLTSSSTQGAVELATSSMATPVQVVTGQVPMQSAPAPTLIVVVGYGPSALSSIEAQARNLSATAPIVVVSLPAKAGIGAVSNAVYDVLGGFGALTK